MLRAYVVVVEVRGFLVGQAQYLASTFRELVESLVAPITHAMLRTMPSAPPCLLPRRQHALQETGRNRSGQPDHTH